MNGILRGLPPAMVTVFWTRRFVSETAPAVVARQDLSRDNSVEH